MKRSRSERLCSFTREKHHRVWRVENDEAKDGVALRLETGTEIWILDCAKSAVCSSVLVLLDCSVQHRAESVKYVLARMNLTSL